MMHVIYTHRDFKELWQFDSVQDDLMQIPFFFYNSEKMEVNTSAIKSKTKIEN